MDVLNAVRGLIRQEAMLQDANRVICALSGGADSVCLAHVMRCLAEEFGVSVECAHFNHGLRGEESDRDEAFVRKWCETRGIPLAVSRGDVRAFASEKHLSIETAARTLRYAFLNGLGDERTRIATAHQADDQTETVLLQLTRGSGLKGLCGIPPVNGRLIRPMLSVTRREVLAYLADNGLEHVEDSTNAEDDAARNRIRHSVLPVLQELNPEVSRTVVRMTRLLRADEQLLSETAEGLVRQDENGTFLSAKALREASRPIASRAIRLAAVSLGVTPEEKHVSMILEMISGNNPSAQLELPGRLTVSRSYDALRFHLPEQQPEFPSMVLPIGVWTELPICDLRIWFGAPSECDKIHGKFTTWFFKKDHICGNIMIRPRCAGDSLRLRGRPEKTLKKWMIEAHIPAKERNRLPVFADEAGVLAVCGLGQDERACAAADDADAVIILQKRT